MLKFPPPCDKVLPHDINLEKIPRIDAQNGICDKVIGSLVGLAIGDALGASVEFRPQQYLAANPVRTMEGGGTWGLEAGKWTDDTSMALCLASSLITHNSFNPYDQMIRYKWWHKYGYFSSTGHCFDIGQATRQSLKEFSDRQKILKIHYRCRNENEVDALTLDSVERIDDFNISCGDKDAAGNGALMRLAPVPLFFHRAPKNAVENAGLSAGLTHANRKAIDACRYYAALIIGAVNDFPKEKLLDNDFYQKQKLWFGEIPLDNDILSICAGSYKKDKNRGGYEQGIRGKGYIVNALEAALWAFWSDGDSFEKGALAAVNLGDDTDTTAAIYGQLAGAYYGYKNIPKEWLEKLYARDLIISIGEWLYFQGSQITSNHSKNENVSPTTTSNNNAKLSEKKIQRTISAAATVQSSSSETNAINNQSKNAKRNSTIRITDTHSSFSSNETNNTSINRTSLSSDAHVQSSSSKSFTENFEHDDLNLAHRPSFYPTEKSMSDDDS
ncbi:unnamed protein product [Rotaria magnacalcarata]|uniref:ADP-ribosylglycohydrolase n=2 Tax=Rotaria magnacalcarata TaxID=392030 RepID=A0A820AQ44_9BILA|nr:unnamed protein product [Rotaria magnacalcarata]CAF1622502.1 unnamed protein product [Rotaria magnacalcarata]CAF2004445.1 unnamed protein product [Rotaria magnacalcarata]CAF2079139.1 unnamed protein product [Rotaria magnacalcarata]CAF2153629.1 unnamed protein product [Rotaria magnacalcarata]